MKQIKLRHYIPAYLRKAHHDGKADRINRITQGEAMPDMRAFKMFCLLCGGRFVDDEGEAHNCINLANAPQTR